MKRTERTIAVTGAKGQLGGELCRMLGERALPLDIDVLDLTDRQATIDALLDADPELVINCAAYTQVDKAESEPELARAVNVGAVENLAEACRRLDCPLVQIGTDYVFGEGGKGKAEGGSILPWTEEDEPSPRGVYAMTKWEGERAAMKWEKHIIVRTCGLYARPCDANAKNFVKTILRLAETKAELRVVNDQRCTPSYVPHVARATLFLAEKSSNGVNGIYHATNRGFTTWHGFASEILRLANKTIPILPITTAEFAAAAPRPVYSVLDTSKYDSLGGPEMPHWKIGLQEYFEEYVKPLELK
ncbi:MAG: dTDP-4-dehydrorhamnose reductase [Pirellulales bacterium]|nr:dTDP-4-dehydrorhamnose reductase [Pirellulales bacterium]